MTRRELERIVDVWRRRLGLERWDLTIAWDEPCDPDEAVARAWRSNTYESARLYFASNFESWSVAESHCNVVHELLHLLHRDVDQAWSALDAQLHRDVWQVADSRYEHAMEGFIDKLASRLVEVAGV